jgi:hypothetical protein
MYESLLVSEGRHTVAEWSCMANDRCPTCEAVVEPFAMTNAEGSETIYDKQVYNTASVVGNEFGADPTKGSVSCRVCK